MEEDTGLYDGELMNMLIMSNVILNQIFECFLAIAGMINYMCNWSYYAEPKSTSIY